MRQMFVLVIYFVEKRDSIKICFFAKQLYFAFILSKKFFMKDLNIDIFTPKIRHPLCKGCMLIAQPFLCEEYFTRSLIVICEYDDTNGAMGFVLNKPSSLYPDELFETLYDFRDPLFVGGPVANDNLYYIHNLGAKVPGSQHICGNVWWGGDFEMIKTLINSGDATIHDVRFFAGYSGWVAGQLEDEVKNESWIVSPLDESLIFSHPFDAIWHDSLERLGDVYKLWANFPQFPRYN